MAACHPLVVMAWYSPLFTDAGTAGILIGVAVSGAVGMLLGRVRIAGISLGVAGALFTGIAWDLLIWGRGHEMVQPGAHNQTIEFLREFGLILFVYAIGLTVGPGFFDRLRAQGLRWNALAAAIVAGGCAVTAGAWWAMSLPGGLAVGLLTGATTNTPSLAAAGQALAGQAGAAESLDLAAAGYAISYPLGIVGIIATLLLLRRLAPAEKTTTDAAKGDAAPLLSRSLTIANPAAAGLTIQALRERAGDRVLISRLARRGALIVARPETVLEAGDSVLGVGAAADLDRLLVVCGGVSELDLMSLAADLQVRQLLVSNKAVSLKTIAELDPLATHGVTITRITRAGIELLATGSTALQLGDRLRAVGTPEAIARFAATVGDSPRDLEHPDLVPVLIGIFLGVLIGSIPVMVPGIPAPLKLGLAGGPLLVALLVASRGRLGPVDIYLPSPAILFMKEFGIVLFLACVGLLSGEAFLATLQRPDGLLLVAIGALITVIPLLIVGFIALFAMKRSYGEIAGLLSGAMTDPPALAFAQASAGGEAPARVYATVYPLSMLARIACAQALMLLWA